MNAYEAWQLVIQGVAVIALLLTLYVYYCQLRTMAAQLQASRDGATAQNILALTSFLQAEEVRAAREMVRVTLSEKPFASWTSVERREASRVCSTYDVAAIVIRMGLVPAEPFVENWGPSIRHCYMVTKPLMEELQKPENSGPEYWDDFEWLYQKVTHK